MWNNVFPVTINDEIRIESMWHCKWLCNFNDYQASYIKLIESFGSLHD